jgi:aflatoxin B1 aldehyde reductase
LPRRYRKRYWNEIYFNAVENIKATVAKYNAANPSLEPVTMVSMAHRWMVHHSKINVQNGLAGDAIIIGASSLNQAVENLKECEGGPLPQEIIDVLDTAYAQTKSIQTSYFR